MTLLTKRLHNIEMTWNPFKDDDDESLFLEEGTY